MNLRGGELLTKFPKFFRKNFDITIFCDIIQK